MVAITAKSGAAVERYGDEFHMLRSAHARNLFHLGELEQALEVTETALTKKLPLEHFATALLNRAVLNLFLGRPARAAEAFQKFLHPLHLKMFDWPDLVKFATFAHEMGYDGAIYLLALYRRISDSGGVPKDVEADVQRWLSETQERLPLRQIYEGKVPRAGEAVTKASLEPPKRRRPPPKRKRKRRK